MPSRLDIRDAQELARLHGGKCFSKKFIDQYTPLKWMCAKGHTWDIAYCQVSRGYWCVQCGKEEARQQMLEKLKLYALKRGGECLSAKYTGYAKKYKWKCNRGHIWEQSYSNLKTAGWCGRCKREDIQSAELKKLMALALKKGGKCLSTTYDQAHSILKWECSKGHVWLAKPMHIKNSSSWCPYCSKKAMHTMPEMVQAAELRGGKCLSTRYANSKTKLKWQCRKGHQWLAIPTKVLRGQWCPECRYDTISVKLRGDINVIRDIAKAKGGKLLSTSYTNRYDRLEFQCRKKHKWTAVANSIVSGNTWCPYCSHNKITIDDMQEIAKTYNGKCLSSRYVDNKTNLTWLCKEGHAWTAPPYAIKRGRWCTVCARLNKVLQKKTNRSFS